MVGEKHAGSGGWIGRAVKQHRHCEKQSDEAIHSFFARRDGLLRFARNDDQMDAPSHSRGVFRPGLANHFRPKRGRRECRVHAAPAVSCAKNCAFGAHEHTGERKHSDIPCAMALRLTPCSPRRRIRLVTVVCELTALSARLDRHRLRKLDASNGRQDHTASPYAKSTVRLVARENRSRGSSRPAIPRAPDAPRPPHPATNVCDDHDTPLDRHGTGEL